MNKPNTFNFIKLYEFILGMCLAVFITLFICFLINSFYTKKQERVNDASVSKIAWNRSNILLRQDRLYNGKQYRSEQQLLVKEVKLSGNLSLNDELPVTLLANDRKTIKAKYFSLSNTMLIPVNNDQIKILKMSLGLVSCFYLLLIIIVIWQVRKMLLSVKNNNYFNTNNAKRMAYISFLFFLIPSFNSLFNFGLERYFVREFEIKDFRFVNDFNFGIWLWLVAGTLAIIMGFIIGSGTQLKKENDLTI